MPPVLKRIFSIVFLVVVLFQSTSTLWILGAFYLNRDRIANTICVNRFETIPICKGQCYLNKELKENEKRDQNFPDLKQKEIPLFYRHNEMPDFVNVECHKIVSYAICEAVIRTAAFHTSVFHPPPFA